MTELESTVESAASILDVNPEEVTYEDKGESLELDLDIGGEDLFGDLTEDDLMVPEKFFFAPDEVVDAKIIDIRKIKNNMGFGVELKVLSGENEGKLLETTMWKPKDADYQSRKVTWKQFLLAVWSKDEILGGKATEESAMGRCITFKASKISAKNNQYYSDFTKFDETKSNNIGF
jgi:hypothetical protein